MFFYIPALLGYYYENPSGAAYKINPLFHHYHFRLLALSAGHLAVPADPSCLDVEQEARKHLIAESVLVAVYRR